MLALIALPLLAYGLLVMVSRGILRRTTLPAGWASSLVVGGVGLFVLVAAMTELLSLFSLLRPGPVAVAWVTTIVVLGLVVASYWRVARSEKAGGATPTEAPALWRGATGWLWIPVGLIVLFTLVVAIAAPPNTNDAISYHLPRQVRWMDINQVRHYGTQDMRELSFPPLAEYMQMHTMLLTGGDVFVHIPQWLSYALAALAGALGCQALGRPRAGPFAALLIVSVPVFYLQATSPKNDGVLVFLAVAFAWLVFHVLRNPRCGVFECVLLGLVLGCAAMTKTTAVLLLFPWCVLVAVGLLVRLGQGAIWRGALIGLVAAILIAPHTARNIRSFGHPFGPMSLEDGGFGLSMERHDLSAVGSNALRHLGLHAMFSSDEHARAVERFVRDIHDRAGWDADDPQTTWQGPYFAQAGLDMEGNAPAPVHVVYFMLAAGILVVLVVRRRGGLLPLAGLACVAIAFLLFVATVKWNEWHTRLHAPMVATAAICIAAAFVPSRRAWAQVAIAVVAATPAVWVLVAAMVVNRDRPLTGPSGVLTHPRNELTRWRTPDRLAEGERVGAVLADLEPGPLAVWVGDPQYNLERVARRLSDRWTPTGPVPNLGRTEVIDPRWTPPAVLITAYHIMPAMVHKSQVFERVSVARSFNVYRAVEAPPPRESDEPVATMGRYSALPDLNAVGQLRDLDAHQGTSWGLVLDPDGVAVPVPARNIPRTLFAAFHPMHGGASDVRVSLEDQVLFEGPIEPGRYTHVAVLVPPTPQASELRIEFPRAQGEGRRYGAAAGWIQLPTEREIADYDAR
jgi:4-amino-4-deoxy-L-arabinose transferase-like glycosyltransferase